MLNVLWSTPIAFIARHVNLWSDTNCVYCPMLKGVGPGGCWPPRRASPAPPPGALFGAARPWTPVRPLRGFPRRGRLRRPLAQRRVNLRRGRLRRPWAPGGGSGPVLALLGVQQGPPWGARLLPIVNLGALSVCQLVHKCNCHL